MTAYLTDTIEPAELERGQAEGVFSACKLYPANATTNPAAGVSDLAKLTAVFETLERIGLPLLIHGEVTDAEIDIFDREAVFIERHLEPLLRRNGFEPTAIPPGSGAALACRRGKLQLLLGPGRFGDWAGWAELGLATAGTATEQLVGLGVPALSLPGPGPQFKAGFARRQSRLLGGAVLPCHSPRELEERLLALLADPLERERLGRIGRQRMGAPGGSAALAAAIDAALLPPA